MSYLLSHCCHVNQHYCSLDPWYLEFSTYFNHCQTNSAKSSNWIILSKNNTIGTKEVQPGKKNRDSQGQDMDNQGQNRDSQGQNRDKGIIGQTPYLLQDSYNTFSYYATVLFYWKRIFFSNSNILLKWKSTQKIKFLY